MDIPLVDLKSQYKKLKKEILKVTEDILDSQNFILGSKVVELENKISSYCGSKYAVGVSSGTDALLLSLMAIGVGFGDIVISTPYTFFATIGSIVRLGAVPLFVDIDPVSYNICPRQIEILLNSMSTQKLSSVKAIIPVHLYGQCAEMDSILKIADSNGIPVIEDAAQAIGAEYKFRRAGSFGVCSCFSFFPSKVLGAFGDAGVITTDSENLDFLLRMLRNHGATQKYFHKVIGGNFRLDAFQAAIISTKIKYLDEWIAARNLNAIRYEQLFEALGLLDLVHLPSRQTNRHTYSQFVINVTSRRDKLKTYLLEHGIVSEIYYPIPLHLQECFAYLGYRKGAFPFAENASEYTLSIPVYPELTLNKQIFVVETVKKFFIKK